MSLQKAGERAVALAEKLGAGEAEAYVTDTVTRALEFHERIETGRSSLLTGMGVRVIVGKRIGFFSTSSIEQEDMENTVKRAISIAKASEPDQDWTSLPTKTGRKTVSGIFDKKTAELEVDTLVGEAIDLIKLVKAKDKRLSPTRGSLLAGFATTAISSSHGCNLTRKSTAAAFTIRVKAEEAGKKGTSDEGREARSWKTLKPEQAASDAAERAIKMMDARRLSSRKTCVVIANELTARILDVMFSRTVSADATQKGRSPWIGKLGQQVALPGFSLMDDGLKRAGLGTRPFDDEGVPQRTTPIIRKGILKSYLYDSYTAAKDHVSSTGNATRSGLGTFGLSRPYTQIPVPAPTNLVLREGDASTEELIEETREGLSIIDSIGEWLSNPISGMLNATVTNAFEIRNGTLEAPVKGVIVSGNFLEIIKKHIDLIGKDIRNSGNVYAPSIRVSEMAIAGE